MTTRSKKKGKKLKEKHKTIFFYRNETTTSAMSKTNYLKERGKWILREQKKRGLWT